MSQADSLPAEPQGKPKNTGMGSLSLLQGIFPTQKLSQGLLHCRRILYQLSYQFSSVSQSCPTLCDPMNCSTPSLPAHHQLPEFTQTNVHQVGDAIQPPHSLSSPSPPAPNPSQHQSLFQWVNSSHEVAKSIGVSALASVLPKYQGSLKKSVSIWWVLTVCQGCVSD